MRRSPPRLAAHTHLRSRKLYTRSCISALLGESGSARQATLRASSGSSAAAGWLCTIFWPYSTSNSHTARQRTNGGQPSVAIAE